MQEGTSSRCSPLIACGAIALLAISLLGAHHITTNRTALDLQRADDQREARAATRPKLESAYEPRPQPRRKRRQRVRDDPLMSDEIREAQKDPNSMFDMSNP